MTVDISDVLKQAFKDNRDDIIIYILHVAEIYAQTAFRMACERGNLKLMKVIHTNPRYVFSSVDMPRQALILAINNNHLDVIKYLINEKIFNIHDLKYPYYSGLPKAVIKACEGDSNILNYLLDLGATITPEAFIEAATCENQEIIDYLIECGGDARVCTIEKHLQVTYKQSRGRLTQLHSRKMATKYLL